MAWKRNWKRKRNYRRRWIPRRRKAIAGKRFIRTNGYKLSRTMNPFPTNYVCQLRYSQVFPIAYSTGAWGHQSFRLNSLFDPDYSGVGHQPRGFDELTYIYQQYMVTGCKVKLKFWQTSSNDTYVGFTTRKDNTVPTIFEDWTEGRYGSSKVIKADDNRVHFKTFYLSMRNFFGKRPQLIDEEARAEYTSNPTEMCNFVIGVNDIGLIASGSIRCEIELVYDAVFTKRKYLASS